MPHDAAVKLLRLRKMLHRVPRPGKMDWPACVLVPYQRPNRNTQFITTHRATACCFRMHGAQTSENHVVHLRPAAVITESRLAPLTAVPLRS